MNLSMNSLCLYNGKVYNKIYSFKYNDIDFTICKENNKYFYFKHDIVNDKDIYTPYDRWLKVFELSDEGKSKIDSFVDSLNVKKIKNDNEIKNLVDNFIYGKKKTKKKIKIFNKYFILLFISLSALIFGGVTLFNW